MSVTAEKVRQLPGVVVPEGYVLRPYRPGDEGRWLTLLQSGGFTDWDRDRLERYLEAPERKEGSRIVSRGPGVVAAVFATRGDSAAGVGVLDYVVSHPEHRGKGLGRAVCTAVLEFLVARGYESVVLSTDDWRLPAIRLYLSLGFVPDMAGEDMRSRWESVMRKIGAEGAGLF